MTTVGFVGLGGMGSRIARRLLLADHELVVWNRTPERMAPLIDLGAEGAETPAEAAGRSNVLMTMVSNPSALRDVT